MVLFSGRIHSQLTGATEEASVHWEGFRIYNYYCCNATTRGWLSSSITQNNYYFI